MKISIAAVAVAFLLQPDNGDAIRDRLDAYLIAYEPQLSSLVAEERMSQRDAPGRNATVTAAPDSKFRSLVSEVAFIGLPGDAGWLGFRRVVQVNGKRVSDAGPPLAVLLTDGASDDYDQARLLLTESARHNLGSPRTTNLPNLPLEFLHPRNRHRLHHRVDSVEKIRGIETTLLVFQEHSTPTIIQRPEGGDMTSLVRAWVETTTGRLIRAEVLTRNAQLGVLAAFDNIVRVEFRVEPKLNMLVPYEMQEVFFAGRFRDGTSTGALLELPAISDVGAHHHTEAMKIIATAAIALLAAIQTPSVDEVVAKLDEYLAVYEPKLSELIADEIMNQDLSLSELLAADRANPNRRDRLRRRLQSEVAFVALPANAGWLGFRHVKTVNYRDVAFSDASLTASLTSLGYAKARALLDASAEHNLGLPRTTNLPNLPLEFLHQRNRKRLLARLDGRERVRGVDTDRVVFLERMTPTLIANPTTGSDRPSVIRAWIVDPANGSLLRAEVRTFASADAPDAENTVRVEFEPNKALGLLVPVEMREEFPGDALGTGTSVARYSNFRRFQTSARIVPQ